MCGGSTDWFDKVIKGVSAAGTVASTAMSVSNAIKADSYANESDDDSSGSSEAAEAAAAETRQRLLAARTKQRSTMLTSGTGLSSPAKTSLKTLFGGK